MSGSRFPPIFASTPTDHVARKAVEIEPVAMNACKAAAFCGVSRAHWWRLVASGRAPRGIKLGARRVWVKAVLAGWLEAGAPAVGRQK